MTINILTTVRNAMLNAIWTAVDAGSGAGYVEIRSGTKPANANTAATGTVLATIALNDPSFATASGGVLTMVNSPVPADTSADATGTATWARVYDSAGNAVFDGTVGTSGTDFIISSTAITSGQTVQILSGTLTLPA